MRRNQLFFWLLCFVVVPAYADDAPSIVQQQCARCHGVDGVASKSGIPHLNGQDDGYLSDSMIKLQKGRLPTSISDHIPAALGSNELEIVADYFAKIKTTRPKSVTDPEKVALGEIIYAKRCADCHPDNGREVSNASPLMAAQDLDYLIAQTKLFHQTVASIG
jgi:cytochrome c553